MMESTNQRSYSDNYNGVTTFEMDGVMTDDVSYGGRRNRTNGGGYAWTSTKMKYAMIAGALLLFATTAIWMSGGNKKNTAPAAGGGSNDNGLSTSGGGSDSLPTPNILDQEQQQEGQGQEQQPNQDGDGDNEGKGDVDSTIFTFHPRHQDAGIYESTFVMQLHEDINTLLGTQTVDMEFEVDGTTTISEIDPSSKIQIIDFVTTRVASNMKAMFMDVKCDSANPTQDTDPVMCAETYQGGGEDGEETVVGSKTTYKIDTTTGDLVESTNNHMADLAQQMRLSSQTPYDETARTLQFIPSTPVSQGDHWELQIDMDELGTLTGTTTFAGFVPCDETETPTVNSNKCSSFVTDGDIDLDLAAAMGTMFDDGGLGGGDDDDTDDEDGLLAATMNSMFVTDGTFHMTLYWDDLTGYAKHTNTEMNFVLNMPNPIDDKETMKIPVKEVIIQNVTKTG